MSKPAKDEDKKRKRSKKEEAKQSKKEERKGDKKRERKQSKKEEAKQNKKEEAKQSKEERKQGKEERKQGKEERKQGKEEAKQGKKEERKQSKEETKEGKKGGRKQGKKEERKQSKKEKRKEKAKQGKKEERKQSKKEKRKQSKEHEAKDGKKGGRKGERAGASARALAPNGAPGQGGGDERWLAAAAQVERTDNPLTIPYEAALQEATLVATFVKNYWEPAGDRPGLKRMQKRLPRATGQEIMSLIHAIERAQARLLLLVDPLVIDFGQRARFIVDELESALEFLLEDDVEEAADQQLAQPKEFHSQDGQRSSALAQSLRDYARLAESLQDRLAEVDRGFDVGLIQEAKQLAVELMAPVPRLPGDASAAVATRNRLLHLLMRRVALVRRTAARVFSPYPEILREVMSTYERRRRAAARREKARDPEETKERERARDPEETKDEGREGGEG